MVDDDRRQTQYHSLKHGVNEPCCHKKKTGKSQFLKMDMSWFCRSGEKTWQLWTIEWYSSLTLSGESDSYAYAYTKMLLKLKNIR